MPRAAARAFLVPCRTIAACPLVLGAVRRHARNRVGGFVLVFLAICPPTVVAALAVAAAARASVAMPMHARTFIVMRLF
jgi:hypothetical protein